MSTYYKFTAIFQTSLIKSAPAKVVLDPVKIEFFKGPRSLIVPAQVDFIVPLEQFSTQNIPFIPNLKLLLPNGPYISITVHTKESVPFKAKQFCEDHLDSTIAHMASVYDSALFAQQVFRGQLLEDNEEIMQGMLLVKSPVSISDNLPVALSDMRAALVKDQELHARYLLMARFLSKSFLVPPSEEKFLYLWTILEIYPMKDTTNIKPISTYLGNLIGKDPDLIREQLEIGKLFGARSNLVHNGRLNIPAQDFVETLMRLESICLEVLRSMMGLPYSGALDKYFVSQ